MTTEKNTLLKIIAGKVSEPMTAQVEAKLDIFSARFEISDADGVCVASGEARVEGACASLSALFAAKPWSVEKPTLYRLSLELKYVNGETELVSDSFGYRYFDTDEKNIYLNGFPFYMRAYIRGCAAHEHQNNCGLSEYDFYKKNILAAKSYGFNTIRFHSTVPPDECFRAADELGILIHIEMRAGDGLYDNLEEMLNGKNDFVSDAEIYKTANRLYNHPSFPTQ